MTSLNTDKPARTDKNHAKFADYLLAMSEVFVVLSEEIKTDGLSEEKRKLAQKIGSDILYRATAVGFVKEAQR